MPGFILRSHRRLSGSQWTWKNSIWNELVAFCAVREERPLNSPRSGDGKEYVTLVQRMSCSNKIRRTSTRRPSAAIKERCRRRWSITRFATRGKAANLAKMHSFPRSIFSFFFPPLLTFSAYEEDHNSSGGQFIGNGKEFLAHDNEEWIYRSCYRWHLRRSRPN